MTHIEDKVLYGGVNGTRQAIFALRDMRDDIGDIMVVLINIMERNNYCLVDCLDTAWKDIKDRKGKMIDGIFVKEADL